MRCSLGGGIHWPDSFDYFLDKDKLKMIEINDLTFYYSDPAISDFPTPEVLI
ncbi:MAG: hypothetical protein KAU03_03610 [Candidatus Altiarchaeales archaeon]|nr:hypothetical protein [Candidatus Altiarchaeales archaeon]